MRTSKRLSPPQGSGQAAWVALVPRVRALARCLAADVVEADDMARSAFASVDRGSLARGDGADIRLALFSAVCAEFRSEARRQARISRPGLGMADGARPAAATAELDQVRRAMTRLSDDHREVLALVDAARLPYADAAEICGCGIGTLRIRAGDARQALSAILGGGQLTTPRRRIGDTAMANLLAWATRASPRAAT